MRIVLNHLTRMGAPRICIAGIDPRANQHIRPITGHSNPLTRDLLASEGGPFAIGTLVELGEVTPQPEAPETEDHLFRPERARVLGRLSSNRDLELLNEHARHRLHEIFGDELVRQGRTYAIDKGCGTVSLGVLRVRRKPDLKVDRYGKLRLRHATRSKCHPHAGSGESVPEVR